VRPPLAGEGTTSHWIPLDAPDRLNELLLDWPRWAGSTGLAALGRAALAGQRWAGHH
jgi:hypothetical protein